jgi:hypothetical protein
MGEIIVERQIKKRSIVFLLCLGGFMVMAGNWVASPIPPAISKSPYQDSNIVITDNCLYEYFSDHILVIGGSIGEKASQTSIFTINGIGLFGALILSFLLINNIARGGKNQNIKCILRQLSCFLDVNHMLNIHNTEIKK